MFVDNWAILKQADYVYVIYVINSTLNKNRIESTAIVKLLAVA